MGNNIKVKDLSTTSSVSVNNKIMVLTNETDNTVQNLSISDFNTNNISTDANNALQKGNDNKLHVADLSDDISSITDDIGDLANLLTSDKTNLVNAINAAQSDITQSIGDLYQLDTSDKSSVVNAINDVYSTASNDYIRSSRGFLEDGKFYSNQTFYNDVYKLAHSTFDSSKFTATGTPTVSSNGIASGFSNSNYLVSNQTIDFTKPFRVQFNENRNTNPVFAGFQIGVSGDETTPLFFVIPDNIGELIVVYYINGSGNQFNLNFLHFDYTDINYIVDWDGDNYIFEIRDSENQETIISHTFTNSNPLKNSNSSNGVILYGFNPAISFPVNSTDLKQTYIKNNGYPVFSGNKTGVDAIKPNKYSIGGSGDVTVSANGIVSGFKNNIDNYIKLWDYNFFDFSKPWQIDIMFNSGSMFSVNQNHWILGSLGSGRGLLIGINYSSKKLQVYATSTGSSWDISGGSSGTNTYDTPNQDYYVRAYWTGTQYVFQMSTDGTNYTTEITINSATSIENVGEALGVNDNHSRALEGGTIDLNTVKAYSEGVLVYQACLRVPYTLSFTGSKIVDISSVNKLIDTYRQFGSACYYTINEEDQNAALPFGEIYSTIAQNVYNNIFSKIVPVYNDSKRIEIGTNTTYTVVDDGFIYCPQLVSSASFLLYIQQNASGPVNMVNLSSGSNTSFCLPVLKGAKITITTLDTNLHIYFMPRNEV